MRKILCVDDKIYLKGTKVMAILTLRSWLVGNELWRAVLRVEDGVGREWACALWPCLPAAPCTRGLPSPGRPPLKSLAWQGLP